MITVKIEINGREIFSCDAVNVGEGEDGWHRYVMGSAVLLHKRKDGARKLAIKMLKASADV